MAGGRCLLAPRRWNRSVDGQGTWQGSAWETHKAEHLKQEGSWDDKQQLRECTLVETEGCPMYPYGCHYGMLFMLTRTFCRLDEEGLCKKVRPDRRLKLLR